jgi:cation diffusion facilitator family transporter
MKECCENKVSELAALRASQGRVLWIVLAINAIMFVVEFAGGIFADSTALMADSLDMLGDATVYAFSLFVLNKSAAWRTGIVRLKGTVMAAFGLGVIGQVIANAVLDSVPVAKTMGGIGFFALCANLLCLLLLLRHRNDDLNMRSTWLCSLNDIIANGGVLMAAGLVALTQSKWPDLVIGTIIAIVFLSSAVKVLWESLRSPVHVVH